MSDLLERLQRHARMLDLRSDDHRDAEIARLEADLERLMEQGRESMRVMDAACRTIDAYKAVVDAAHEHCEIHRRRGTQHFTHHIAGCYLCQRLRTLDGEVKHE